MWNNLIVHMKICHSGCFKKKLDGLARLGGGQREHWEEEGRVARGTRGKQETAWAVQSEDDKDTKQKED